MGGIKRPTTSREAIRWLYYRLKSAVAPSLIWIGWAAVAGHNAPRIHCVGDEQPACADLNFVHPEDTPLHSMAPQPNQDTADYSG